MNGFPDHDGEGRSREENKGEAGEPVAKAEQPGEVIGRYTLLRQIGEGGCGVVYQAQQDTPVRRVVALKIIKAGMDTSSVIARFEAERQALARMDHPGIAKILDAGATATGRPYFAMEYVRGVKITEYCDRHALPTRERLSLFIQVCQAVQHAHQKGVIHRDLKPSNILVVAGENGGGAQPVVIDFGIAKATNDQRLTDKTLFTAFEMLIGTPAYMSPEQATLGSEEVDTRTDVYSLGVLFYELLTGSTPFEAGELLKAGLDDVRRAIREQDPVRPSARLARLTTERGKKTAGRQRPEVSFPVRTIPGDLDWITMKALEKDRARRYGTADDLALDIRRFLADEAILARPPDARYRFRKAFARNRVLFSGLAVVVVSLVGTLLVVSGSLARERRARRETDAALHQQEIERTKAQLAAEKSGQLTQFLKEMLQGVGPAVAMGRDTTMLREILDRTVERLGPEMAGQPAIEAELRGLIGRLYLEIANYDQAEKMHRASLALYQGLRGAESEQAAEWSELGLVLWKKGDLAGTEQAHREALALRRRLFGEEHRDVAASLNNLAGVYRKQQRLAEGEAMMREALRIRRKTLGNHHIEVAESLNNLSIVLGDQGKYADAETAAREVLEIRRALLGPEHPLVAAALMNLAWVVGWTQRFAEAEGWMREALAIQRKVLGAGHPSSLLTLRNLGLVLKSQDKLAEAEAVHREGLARWIERAGLNSPQALTELESIVGLLAGQKRLGEAEVTIDEILGRLPAGQTAPPPLLALRVEIIGRQGRWRDAVAEAGTVLERMPADHYRYHVLASILAILGDRTAYAQLCGKILGTFAGTKEPYFAQRMAQDCLLLAGAGVDYEVVDKMEAAAFPVGSTHVLLPLMQANRALSSYRQGRLYEAVERAEQPIGSANLHAQISGYAVLAMAQQRRGNNDGARMALARGAGLLRDKVPARDSGDLGTDWPGWISVQLLMAEATAVVAPETKAGIEAKPQ